MINIILSPSQQKWNKCSQGDSEQDHCWTVAKLTFDILQSYDCNTCLIPKLEGTEQETLEKVVAWSNDFVVAHEGMSFHLDIHTDGGYKGRGCSAFYVSENGRGFIMPIYKAICDLTPWGDGQVTERSLYVLNHTIAYAGLIELSFHDNKEQSQWIHNNIQQLAAAIVAGLERSTGIKRIREQQHWAESAYQQCLAKGYVIHDRRFDDPLTRGEFFSILAQK